MGRKRGRLIHRRRKMLILSTKLIVNEQLTHTVFVQMVIDWLSGNHNYGFDTIEYPHQLPMVLDCEKDHLEIMEYGEALTVRLVSNSNGVIWTNDYVLTSLNNQHFLSVQLYSDTENMSVKMPERFNKPRIINQIVANGFSGMDGDIPVSDTPLIISAETVAGMCDLIMKKTEYVMPIIYVTYPRYALYQPVDFDALAKSLSGVAHVVVEPRNMASEIRQKTDEHNPYDGAVQIFYGKNNSYRLLPDNYRSMSEMRSVIENMVYQKVLMIRMDDNLSWMRIHFRYLQEKNQDDPELFSVYEKLLKGSENDAVLKQQRIDELEYQVMELEDQIKDMQAVINQKESEIQNYQYRFQQSDQMQNTNKICIESTEADLYEGERKDIILRVLDKERKQMDMSQDLCMSRKFHVLSNVLQLNKESGREKIIIENLRGIIDKGGNLNSQKKRQLVQAGFNIKGDTHYKITYKNDKRYSFTLSKTASDYRSNINTLKDAENTLFGR